ncbi:MAG: hypothetical protein ABUL73_04185 [Alphaproteobacteria bacterium]
MKRAPLRALALLACLFVLGLDAGPAPLIRAEAWTQATPHLAHDLTTAPGECYAPPADPAARQSAEIGRALFRSPALIGGPAARMGLSCEACHDNGRANAHFYLDALTDTPGAADVTSSWSSRLRGDGVMNPRPIPDLVDVGARPTHGAGHIASLDAFVHSVIVEEFQGAEPSPQAMASLLTYLRALHSDACTSQAETPITLASQADDVRRALDVVISTDVSTRPAVLLAARALIGRIAERLPAPEFTVERADLAALSRELANGPASPRWRARFDALIARITPRGAQTYYNEQTLQAALAARRDVVPPQSPRQDGRAVIRRWSRDVVPAASFFLCAGAADPCGRL